ncbi:hypothetical protein [Nocardia stercoris]|uniref:Secreted protein n=1 Tax=Nocardia stercoris TaxID=2483361 RepID=A0A3M2LDA0_9NOCA|nr:hypothetical protein [Nocardia stercoris]RMI35517.1 hypothetical protein EBN03_04525 [Nocardia stercoris]
MPITFRGAAFAGAALAVLAGPAVAQADPVLPVQPVAALWDPQTGSSSISSNVTATTACLVQTVVQSLSGGPALNCVNGAR